MSDRSDNARTDEDLPTRRLSLVAHVVFAIGCVAVIAAYAFVVMMERRSPGWTVDQLQPKQAIVTAPPAETSEAKTPTVSTPVVDQKHADGLFERGRTVASGEWINVPFSAKNFTASDGMQWVVKRADVVTCAYTVIGNTMTFTWFITNTATNGTQANFLEILLPSGYVPARRVVTTATYSDTGASWLTGLVEVDSQPPRILLGRNGMPASKWMPGTGIATAGQITFDVRESASSRRP